MSQKTKCQECDNLETRGVIKTVQLQGKKMDHPTVVTRSQQWCKHMNVCLYNLRPSLCIHFNSK